ncbi:MAG: SUMF1/EgtB/PvdO family nonheme iron enzyme [Pseudomonadota bacterium]
MNAEDLYPARLRASVGSPSPETPLTHVSAAAAVLMAEAVGCRLPTSDEWAAAWQATNAASRDANVRDATWALQRDHMAQRLSAGRASVFPDRGAFTPRIEPRPPEGAAATVFNESDGALWFRETAPASGSVRDLRGNVWEWLAGPAGSPSDLCVGGSAISAPEVPMANPQERSGRARSFADVGFRLAFTGSGSPPIGPRFAQLMADIPFVPPAP